MDVAVLAIVSLLLIFNLRFSFTELIRDFRLESPRRWAVSAGVFLALLFFVLAAGSRLPLRGGYDNEKDFGFMAQGSAFASDKELSPVAIKLFTDLAGGGNLEAHLIRNAVLLVLNAALVAAALIRIGINPAAGAAAGLLLLFNFLSLLNAKTFSSTLSNVYFLLSGVYALSVLIFSEKNTWRNLVWTGCAFLLAFGARFEFVPALAAGLGVSLVTGGAGFRGRLALACKSRPVASVLAGACFLALAGAWVFWLASSIRYNGPQGLSHILPSYLAENFVLKAGERNIAVFSGLPAGAAALAAALLLIVPFAAGRQALSDRRNIFLGVWTVAWVVIFSVAYQNNGAYPLHFMRHDLYFFIPLVFAAGNAAHVGMGLARRAGIKYAVPACAALLIVYCAANLKAAYALDGQLRTNDREWQFLLKARGQWPAGCRAICPCSRNRAELLDRYFNQARSNAGEEPCVMVYRSPYGVIFRKAASEEPGAVAKNCQDAYLKGKQYVTIFEEQFRHAFYTVWDGDSAADLTELRDPVTVTAGFYRLGKEGAEAALAALRVEEQVSEVLREGIRLQNQGRFSEAAEVFSGAIDGGLRDAAVYNAAGVALLMGGDPGGAVCRFKAALKADPGFWQARSSLDYIKHKHGAVACARKAPAR